MEGFTKQIRKIKKNLFWETYISILIVSGITSTLGYLFGNVELVALSLIYPAFITVAYSFRYIPVKINSKESRYESFSPKVFQTVCVYLAYFFYPILFTFGFWMMLSRIISSITGIDVVTIVNYPFFEYFSVVISSLLYLTFFKMFIEAASKPAVVDTINETES
ncbi:MAG: hypothetical protein LBE57_03985 [Methanosarcinales archaeon]|jgi:uncharacterized membrane protein YccF (DUF307 family)|nr:hypothetical protein [Methanosarcinales archaeon]